MGKNKERKNKGERNLVNEVVSSTANAPLNAAKFLKNKKKQKDTIDSILSQI